MQPALKKSLQDEIYRSGDSDYMVSLARGLHVIQVFCDDGRHKLTIADVTRMSGLSRTVVSRCLYTLRELGFVGRTGRYFYLLPKCLKLGYGYVSTASLPGLAQPILDGLATEARSAAAVTVLEGPDVLYIAKSVPPSSRNVVTITVNIGHRRPAYVTASGLVLLASLKAELFDAYMDELDDKDVLATSSRSKAEIVELVEKAREDDYAQTELVFAKSMRALAVPVRNVVGNVVAAMVLAIYDDVRSDEDLLTDLLPRVRRSAKSLSDKLID